nr:hypothetical protein [Kocuria atrinae]
MWVFTVELSVEGFQLADDSGEATRYRVVEFTRYARAFVENSGATCLVDELILKRPIRR